MNVWHDVSYGENMPEEVNVIVEIPTGSQNKYEIDKDSGLLKLDRVLYSPFHYPGDYGFIPQTLGQDNDPLDGLVLVNFPTYPLTLMNVRPIGVLRMIDGGEGDEKILCVPVDDVRHSGANKLSDIPQAVQDEIAHFFQTYKQLEKKSVEINGWGDADEAKQIIRDGVVRYQEKFSSKKA
ncbi:MAG TPA: inorganic diphosphatase [Candidatus Andersenbacteria bacterium]|nr:inorganic diphosphatase [Candidatus Andersenbacteria bacterium]